MCGRGVGGVKGYLLVRMMFVFLSPGYSYCPLKNSPSSCLIPDLWKNTHTQSDRNTRADKFILTSRQRPEDQGASVRHSSVLHTNDTFWPGLCLLFQISWFFMTNQQDFQPKQLNYTKNKPNQYRVTCTKAIKVSALYSLQRMKHCVSYEVLQSTVIYEITSDTNLLMLKHCSILSS